MLDRGGSRGRDTKVLVCGGGPTGLLAGLLLARGLGGSVVRVVDAQPAPSPLSKALAVQVRTLEILTALGLAEEAIRRGLPFEGVTLHSAGCEVPITLSNVDSPRPHALILPQSDLEDILRRALLAEGVRVERNCRLQGFLEGDAGVEVELHHFRDNGKLDRAEKVGVRILIGCDGAHSTVRHGLQIPFEGGHYENEFILTDCRCSFGEVGGSARRLERGVHFGVEGSRGIMLLFPFAEEGRYRIVCTRAVHKIGPGDRLTGAAPKSAELPEFADRAREIFGAEFELSDPTWLATYKIHSRLARRYSSAGGRVFIAGDAAHVHSPVGGLGMNTGLQDAYNLAWKIVLVLRGVAGRELLESYEAERRPVGGFLVNRTDAAFRAVVGGGCAFHAARWLLLNPLFGRNLVLPFVVHRMPNVVSQINITYSGGPLAPLKGGRRSVVAGDRAPDVTGLEWTGSAGSSRQSLENCGTEGERTSLHNILSAQCNSHTFTLVLLEWSEAELVSGSSPRAAAMGALRDSPINMLGLCPLIVVAVNSVLKDSPEGNNSCGSVDRELPVMHLSDPNHTIRRRYGLCPGPSMVLVRPDFHVAFLTDRPNPLAAVTDFLSRLHAV